MKKYSLNNLNEEQRGAILSFAAKHGRTWKSKLAACWIKAGCPGMTFDKWAPLQQVRNQFGPAWLNAVVIS